MTPARAQPVGQVSFSRLVVSGGEVPDRGRQLPGVAGVVGGLEVVGLGTDVTALVHQFLGGVPELVTVCVAGGCLPVGGDLQCVLVQLGQLLVLGPVGAVAAQPVEALTVVQRGPHSQTSSS